MLFSIIMDCLTLGIPGYFIIRTIRRDLQAKEQLRQKQIQSLNYEQDVEARYKALSSAGWTKQPDSSNPADYVRYKQFEKVRRELENCRQNKAAYHSQIDQTVRYMIQSVKDSLQCSQIEELTFRNGLSVQRKSCISSRLGFGVIESKQYEQMIQLDHSGDLYVDMEAYKEIRRRFLEELRQSGIFTCRKTSSGTIVLTDADFPADISLVGRNCVLCFVMEV